MYKTEETALKHIESGEHFAHKNFSLFRDNEEVALTAISKNYDAYQYTDIRSEEFAIKALKANTSVYVSIKNGTPDYLENPEIRKLSAKQERFLYFQNDAKDDKELVLINVREHGGTIIHASDRLQKDKDVQLTAVSTKGYALSYLDAEAKADKEVVLAACKNDADAIQYASKEIRELCKNQNPVKVLEAHLLASDLQANLASKSSQVQHKTSRLKI